MNTSLDKPEQRISTSKKLSDRVWQQNCGAYYGQVTTLSSSIKDEMRVLYGLASGIFNEKDYEYVLYPYGEEQRTREELKGDNSKIRNYDIITPGLNILIGEFIERGYQPKVLAINSDVQARKKAFIKEKIKENLIADFHNALKEQGIDTEMSLESSSLQDIYKKAESIPDTQSTLGQESLDYIKHFNEVDRKLRLGFFDFNVIGRVFSYRDVFKNDTYYEIINPLGFDYNCSEDTVFIEDGESAWYENIITYSDFIDRFGDNDLFTKEDIENIKERFLPTRRAGEFGGGSFSATDRDFGWERNYTKELVESLFGRVTQVSDGIPLKHIVWKSERKIGKLYINSLYGSDKDYIEVDEDFKPRKYEKVEWIWVNEVWEIYEAGGDVYSKARPIPVQRGNINNPSACKLPYNGVTFSNRSMIPNTPVKRGKAYQELHNILKYRMERTIAKNKDKMVVMPLGLIPDRKEMDMFSMMYYGDYHGYLFVDESNPKVREALNAIRSIDMSMSQYIKSIYDICTALRLEYEESIGISRQRKGQTSASDAVGTTERAVYQGTLMSEESFIKYYEFADRDSQALIDLSKYAWAEGKNETYFNSEREVVNLIVDPIDYSGINFGIFTRDTKREKEKLESFRDMSLAFAQNGANPTAVGSILNANNMDQLMVKLDEMEKELQENAQQARQTEIDLQRGEQEFEMAKQDKELEFKYYDANLKAQTSLNSNLQNLVNTISTGNEGAENNDLNKILTDTIQKVNQLKESQQKDRELNIKEEEIKSKDRQSKRQLEIAKENKNKYDSSTKKK